MQVLHTDGSDFCDFVRCLLRLAQKLILGKEGLAVYTRMPSSSLRKDPNVNVFM